jgi:LPS sulfotransferase NodH
MTAPLQNLPVGIQSFADLRGNGYLYVDKTEIVHRLVSTGKTYFLSRPRRFGKSLLVSTLEALFLGQKEFFKDLWIEDKWDWSQSNPVIRLDMSEIDHETPEELRSSLLQVLATQAAVFGVSLQSETLSLSFSELIRKIHDTTGRQVVVLVDEYDKAIVDHLSHPETAEAIRGVLRDF